MNKKHILGAIFGGIASVLVVSGIFLYLSSQNAGERPNIVLEEAGNKTDKEDYEETVEVEENTPKTGFERALATLEKPNAPVDGEDLETVRGLLTILFTSLSETEETMIIPRREDGSLLSSTRDLKTLKGYLLDGYTYSEDKVSVYLSEHDNVLQFIVLLTSPDDKDVAVTGNYQKEVEQLQIGVFKK